MNKIVLKRMMLCSFLLVSFAGTASGEVVEGWDDAEGDTCCVDVSSLCLADTLISDGADADTDTLVNRKPNYLMALAETEAVNALILANDYFIQDRDYARISRHVLEHNFKTGLVWDSDSFSGNQFSHPYHGSLFYNAARQNGLNYWQSLPFPVLGSLTWEFLCETNEPALNDVLSTGIGGSLIGEVTHRTSDMIFDNRTRGVNRVARELIGTLLNPLRGIHRIVSGEMWRMGSQKGQMEPTVPFHIDTELGDRYISARSDFRRGMHVPYLAMDYTYGNRFSDDRHQPFDWFRLSMLMNFSSKQSTFSNLDIRGRLASLQLHSKDEAWNVDFGAYQLLKYLETYPIKDQPESHFPIISEAVSFGGGAFVAYDKPSLRLTNDFIFSVVPLGGQRSDYFSKRKYNFSHGFSVRNGLEMAVGDMVIGDELYYARFFTFRKYSLHELQYRTDHHELLNTPGDEGQSSVLVNRMYLRVPLMRHVKFRLEHDIHYRHSNYRYYPSVSTRFHEYKAGLAYIF